MRGKSKSSMFSLSKGLLKYLSQDPPTESSQRVSWEENDTKAQAVIGLTLSDELLENVRETKTAKEIWAAIKNVFERHTLTGK